LPGAGDRLVVVPDEKTARETVAERLRREGLQRSHGAKLEDVGNRITTGTLKELSLVVKTDVQGSIDAVRQALEQLSSEETQVRVIHAATGAITESDIMLAAASDAIVIGFNVRPEQGAERLAAQDGIQVRNYSIIYRLIEDVEAALKGMLEPTYEDVIEGTIEVREVYPLGKRRKLAGCYVTDGKVARGALARVLRGGNELFDGPIGSLRRFKDDVREVATGYECGLSIDGFNDFEIGDTVQTHRRQQVGT
jgi:translation initiation factor IF-2